MKRICNFIASSFLGIRKKGYDHFLIWWPTGSCSFIEYFKFNKDPKIAYIRFLEFSEVAPSTILRARGGGGGGGAYSL